MSHGSLQNTLIPSLSTSQRVILEWLVALMRQTAAHEESTKMSPLALVIVLVPCLIKGEDPISDTRMCLQPGKTLPPALRGNAESSPANDVENGTLVGVLEMWILGNAEKP